MHGHRRIAFQAVQVAKAVQRPGFDEPILQFPRDPDALLEELSGCRSIATAPVQLTEVPEDHGHDRAVAEVSEAGEATP